MTGRQLWPSSRNIHLILDYFLLCFCLKAVHSGKHLRLWVGLRPINSWLWTNKNSNYESIIERSIGTIQFKQLNWSRTPLKASAVVVSKMANPLVSWHSSPRKTEALWFPQEEEQLPRAVIYCSLSLTWRDSPKLAYLLGLWTLPQLSALLSQRHRI